MKLISYSLRGSMGWGVETEFGIFPGAELLEGTADSVLAVLISGRLGQLSHEVNERLSSFRHWIAAHEVQRCKPIPDPVNIVCVGLNYAAHAAEVGRGDEARPKPTIFIKRTEALVADGEPIWLPRESRCLDYEGELAFVLSRPAYRIAAANAWDYIAGYTIMNDGSVRDYQKSSVTAGKNFYRSGALGPALVTADEFAATPVFEVETRVNGHVVQRDSTRSFIVDIPELLAYISSIMPLSAGTIIATGTPAGVALGQASPRWLQAGDEVEVRISGLGSLRNVVVDAV